MGRRRKDYVREKHAPCSTLDGDGVLCGGGDRRTPGRQKHRPRNGRRRNSSSNSNNNSNGRPPLRAQPPTLPSARHSPKCRRPRSALEAVHKKLETAFLSSTEWTTAQTELKQAQTEYDAAVAPAKAAIHATPEYKAALAEKEQASKSLNELRSSTPDDQAAITEASNKMLTASSALSKIETAAMADDPKIAPAKAKLAEANKKTTDVKATFEAGIKTDTEWVAAKKTLDDAKQKLLALEAKK